MNVNVYQAPRADLFWMTPEERTQSALALSARRWTAAGSMAAFAQVASSLQADPAFLLAHGSAALFSLLAGAALASTGAARWLEAPLPAWIAGLLLRAGVLLAAGLAGMLAAAGVLAWWGHESPLGPLAALGPRFRIQLFGCAAALALAGCGAWASLWRWRLARSHHP